MMEMPVTSRIWPKSPLVGADRYGKGLFEHPLGRGCCCVHSTVNHDRE